MLSDGTLIGLKPKATAYKVADRDGMYVTVSPKGTITFRLDYRLNGRRETLTVGRYGARDGISLLMARGALHGGADGAPAVGVLQEAPVEGRYWRRTHAVDSTIKTKFSRNRFRHSSRQLPA